MSVVKKVFKNVSYLLFARTLFRVLTAIALIYAANYLGTERFGMLETATAWANAFLALNDIGMSTLIVREASRDKNKMAVYFGNTLIVELILSIVLFAVVIGIGLGIGYDSTTITLMAIMGAAGLIYEFRKVMRGIFRVMMRLKAVAILEVINGALYLLLAIWIFGAVTDKDMGLIGLAHANLWTNVLMVVALFIYTLKFVKPHVDLRQIPAMVKQSYVFTLYNMFFMLYFQIDQIILSIMRGPAEVGIYSAPAKIVNVFLFIPIMTFQVTMPLMWRLSSSNMEKYKKVNMIIWRYLAAFGVPAGIGLALLASEIVPFVFRKPEYLASIPVMAVLGWFLSVRFMGISQGNSMTTSDREGLRAVIQIISVGINIVLDIWLIARYGAYGAAIATLITETLICSSYIIYSVRQLQESVSYTIRQLAPIGAATAVMSGLIALAKGHLHVIVLVVCGALVYLLFLWIFRFFKATDKQMLKQLTSRS